MFTPVPTYPAQSVTSRLISATCCSLPLAHHCQTVSVLGLLLPPPMASGGTPRHSWVSTHTFTPLCCLQGCGALHRHTKVEVMCQQGFATAEPSTAAKLLEVLALHRKLPEIHVLALQQLQESSSHSTQRARAVLQGLPSSLQQIWDLCNSHHYFQALKMQDMALSGLG